MTRINVVSPAELYDQHLLIELRELPRMFTYIENHYKTGMAIPQKYTLGTGHMKFFADKALYLFQRMFDLHVESKERGFNFNFDELSWRNRFSCLPVEVKKDYVPDERAKTENRQRLKEKLLLRPGWYRYLGERVD